MFDQLLSSGNFYDQGKVSAAQAAGTPQADGRTILGDADWLKLLNPVGGISKVYNPATANGMSPADYAALRQQMIDQGADVSHMPTTQAADEYQDAQGRRYNVVGTDADGSPLIQYADVNGGGFRNPTGSDKDSVQATYKLDAQGNATPVSAHASYQPGEWVNNGRDTAKYLGTVLSAGALGATAAGAGGAFDLGAAGAGAGTGGAAADGAGGLSFAGNGAGASLGGGLGGGGIAGDVGAQVGAMGAGEAGAGITNGALADSAIGSAGYGASSAGAGGVSAGQSLLNGVGNYFANGASGVGSLLGSSNGLGAAAQLVSGYLGSSAAKKAAETQANSAAASNALLKSMYDQTRADNMPALEARNNGLTGYQNLLKDPSSVTKDPGYAFGQTEGIKGVQNSAAGRGSLYSGATLKALDRYNTDYATTKYDNALGRYGTLAGIGQPGASTTANASQNYGNQASQNITGAGNASASGYVGSANAWGSAIGNAFNNYQSNNLWNNLLKQNGG